MIKKQMFFIYCIISIIFFTKNDLKCSASCINEKKCVSKPSNQVLLTSVDNEDVERTENYYIELWEEKYMDRFFADLARQKQAFTEESRENAISYSESVWKSILQGDVIGSCKRYFVNLLQNASEQYGNYLKTGYLVLFFSIVSSLYVVLADVIKSNQIAQMGEYILYMLCAIKVVSSFQALYQEVAVILNQIVLFVKLLLPAYASVMGLTNGIRSATLYYEGILAIIWIVENILVKILLPIVQLNLILVVIGGIWKGDRLVLLQNTVNKFMVSALRFFIWLIGIVGALQSFITPVIDTLEWKTMKKVVGMLPGVGNISEGISDIFFGSAIFIRNGMGVFLFVMLFMLCGIPILKLFVVAASIKVMAGLGHVISHNQVSVFADRASNTFFILGKVLFTGIGLFLLCIAITMFSAGRNGY